MDYKKAIENYKQLHGHNAMQLRAVLFDMDGVLFDSMPFHADAWSRVMTDALCAATELFLKREDVDDIVQGNEYVVATDAGEVLWRKMRYAQNKKNTWRLVSRNREDFPDILLSHRNIKAAWRVIAKTTIMTK